MGTLEYINDMAIKDAKQRLEDKGIVFDEETELEEVLGTTLCQYSVIEQKLAVLYRNQVKIFNEIKKLNKSI